jgi:uncharacterized protein YneF (UPF0154 family)
MELITIIFALVTGLCVGFFIGESKVKKYVERNALSKQEADMVRQVISVLSFGGGNENSENTTGN